jgi:hypothetical protein
MCPISYLGHFMHVVIIDPVVSVHSSRPCLFWLCVTWGIKSVLIAVTRDAQSIRCDDGMGFGENVEFLVAVLTNRHRS